LKVISALRQEWAFLFILLFFTVGVVLQQIAMPIMEGYDETFHYNYVVRLRADRRLPDRTLTESNGAQQESNQPPLTYFAMVVVMNVFNVPLDTRDPLFELEKQRNLWFTPINQWRHEDNGNVYYHGPDEQLFEHPEVVAGDRAARVTSLLFGIIAVFGCYAAAREVFPHRRWALIATVLFAFTPQMQHISAVVSNDVGATAFATLVIWQTLALIRHGAKPGRLLAIGVLLGLTGLSKVNALLVGVGVLAALLIQWRTQRQSLWTLIRNALLVGLPFIVIFGPWVLYGWINYHSPLGLEVHNKFKLADQTMPTAGDVFLALLPVYFSYLGKFGGGSIWMPPLMYGLMSVIAVGSISGYILFFRSRPTLDISRSGTQQGIMLLAVGGAMFAGLLYWLVQLFDIYLGIQGRLIYPAHAAFVILLTGGLYLLDKRLAGRLRLSFRGYIVALPMVASLVVTPLFIRDSYGIPHLLTRDSLPALQGAPIDFDHTIRLLGYAQTDFTIRTNALHTVTLCWEVLQPTTKFAAFSLKIFDGADVIADRTSVPGMGHFNSVLWKSGDIFCDEVDIQPKVALKTAYTYDVLVTILGWQATNTSGAPIEVPYIAKVVSPAGDMRANTQINWQPTDIAFKDFANLAGVATEGTPAPGARLKISLLWDVKGRTSITYSQFIHLIGPQTALLADSIPRDTHYPTWAWISGEKIVDAWQVELPASLPPGDYTIQLGFYQQSDGKRLAVSKDGRPSPSDSVPILAFKVG